MALKVIKVKYEVDNTDLERSKQLISQIAKEAGMAEDEVKKVSNELGKQTTQVAKLQAQEKELAKVRAQTNDPKKIAAINKEIANTQAQIKSLTGEVQKSGNQMAATFAKLGIAVGAAFAVRGISQFLSKSVDLAAQMEQNKIAFQNFTGSAANADKLLKQIEATAAKTPFEFPELVESAKQLMAFGIDQKDVNAELIRLGDIAAGTGTDLKELAFVYGQIRTQQVAYTQDLNQFAQRGIPIFDELGKRLGVSASEVKKFASEGKIGFEDIQAVMMSLTGEGGKFFNLMERQSESTSGKISNLKDNFSRLMREIGEKLLPVVNGFVDGLNRILGTEQKVTDVYDTQIKQLSETKGQLNALVPALKGLDKNSVEYKATIDQIVKVYPDFLKGLDKQNLSYDQMKTRLEEVNKELDKQIGLLIRQSAVAQAQDDMAKTVAVAGKAFVGLIDAIGDANSGFQRYGQQFSEFDRKLLQSLDRTKTSSENIDELRAKFQQLSEEGVIPTNSSIGFLLNQYDKNQAKLKGLQEIVNATTKSLTEYTTENKISTEETGNNTDATDANSLAKKGAIKANQDLADAIKKLRQEAELEAVGGADSEAGLNLLRDRAMKELELEKGFAQLTGEEKNLLRLKLEREYDEKIIALAKEREKNLINIELGSVGKGQGLGSNFKKRQEEFEKSSAAIERTMQMEMLFLQRQETLELENAGANEEARADISQKFADKRLEIELQVLEEKLALNEAYGQDTLEIEQQIADVTAQIEESKTEKIQTESAIRQDIQQQFADFMVSSLQEIYSLAIQLQDQQTKNSIEKAEKERDKRIDNAAITADEKARIEQFYNDKIAKLEREQQQRRKQAAIIQAIIDGALAVQKGIAEFGPPPSPLGIAAIALAGIITGAQIALIEQQQFAKGVIDLEGPGTGTSDSIPARLSRGESVMTAEETRQFKPLLLAIRKKEIDPEIMNKFLKDYDSDSMQVKPYFGFGADSFTDERMVLLLGKQVKGTGNISDQLKEQNEYLRIIASNRGNEYKVSRFTK